MNQSGASLEDHLNMALELLSQDQGTTFSHLRCYNILKQARSPSSDVPQSLPTSEPAGTADEGSVSTTTPADSQSTDRPMGKKKAKAIHRSRVDGSEDWKDNVAMAQKEIAAQAKRQNDIAETKAQSMKSIVQTAEMNAVNALMTKDLSACNPVARRYFELKQQSILEALEAESNWLLNTTCYLPSSSTPSESISLIIISIYNDSLLVYF
ncbi:hypothetical protein PGT21_003418 [Puccinia graminis f. sp. tritici]|uniref:No apical meristem-associated C-terminal domain-containing protein n=1 Tax=Puccinia graminis f. sp. tritici TaxID=56615 RepID=A0A5B0Q9Y2_PUCGR|nr:hypothetical protein PGT21_003418 [Puccinia graminis f. sp. tritici]